MDNADLYKENNGLQMNIAQETFDKYGSKIKWKKDNNRIIDLGSGEGTTITALQKYFPSNATLIGCDRSDNMVKLANKHFYDEHTSFIKLDIGEDMPEKLVEHFSHIFSFCALNWVRDHKRAFNNIFNLLEPDGECFLVFITHHPLYEVYRCLAHDKKWRTWVYDVDRYVSPYHDSQDPKTEVTTIIKNIGFDVSLVEHEEMSYVFEDMEALKKALRAVNPFNIPNEKYDDFWMDYVELWQKFNYKGKQSPDFLTKDIKFYFHGVIIHARKTIDAKESQADASYS